MATKPQPTNIRPSTATAEALAAVDAAVAHIPRAAPYVPSPEPDTQPVHVDEAMADQADAIGDAANTESITKLIQAIGSEMDAEKAKIAVGLLNLTNYIVQLRGRDVWNTRDFLAFGVALAALEQIDRGHP